MKALGAARASLLRHLIVEDGEIVGFETRRVSALFEELLIERRSGRVENRGPQHVRAYISV